MLLSAMHPVDSSWPEARDLDAVYIFDLKIAQVRGLKLYRTGSFAIILKKHHGDRSIGKSSEIQQKPFGDRFFFDKRLPQVEAVY